MSMILEIGILDIGIPASGPGVASERAALPTDRPPPRKQRTSPRPPKTASSASGGRSGMLASTST